MNLPIAMLHYISDDPAHESLNAYCIKRKAFLQLLNYIESNNYETITFADISTDKNTLRTSSKKIILTFDDCPRHLFDFAIPEMIKRKMKGSFYMPTAHMGQYNSWDADKGAARVDLMNEAEVKELDRLGMEVGAHSHHHTQLKEITDSVKVTEEITLCKHILEDIIGKPVYSFAFPFASIPGNYKQILSQAGYQYGLSIYQKFESRWALRRFGYYDIDTEKSLHRKLSPLYKWYRRLSDPLKKY